MRVSSKKAYNTARYKVHLIDYQMLPRRNIRLSNRLGFYERVMVGGETRQELHSSFVFIEYSTDHLHHLASSAITSSDVYDLSLYGLFTRASAITCIVHKCHLYNKLTISLSTKYNNYCLMW